MPTPENGFVRSAVEEEEEEGRADGGAKGGDEGALEDASEEDGREGGEDHADWQDLADQRHLFGADDEEEEAELGGQVERLRVVDVGGELLLGRQTQLGREVVQVSHRLDGEQPRQQQPQHQQRDGAIRRREENGEALLDGGPRHDALVRRAVVLRRQPAQLADVRRPARLCLLEALVQCDRLGQVVLLDPRHREGGDQRASAAPRLLRLGEWTLRLWLARLLAARLLGGAAARSQRRPSRLEEAGEPAGRCRQR